MDLIQEVRKRQLGEGLSDSRFALKLGISRQMWESILKGKRHPGYKVLSAIATTYPDLTDDVLDVVDKRILREAK